MEKTKLKNFITQIRGVSYKPKDISEEPKEDHIALLRADALQKNNILFDNLIYVHKDRVKKDQILVKGDILVATSSGSIDVVGKTAQFIFSKNPVTLGAFCKILRPNNVNPSFIKYFFQTRYYRQTIRHLAAGANINNIRTNDLDDLDIFIFSKDYQELASKILDNVENIIRIRKEQIQAYDDLIESLFFEIINKSSIQEISFDDMFEIIDGDRGKNYPKKNDLLEEGHCLFLNTKNVTKTGFKFDQLEFITEEKDNKLRKGKTKTGDFILTTRGTVGNIAYIDEDIEFKNIRINSGMVILRRKLEINPKFFEVLIRKTDILVKAKSGSAQPQLPIKSLKKVLIPTIDLELQNKFADYVLKIEEEKKKLRESLEELETLFDALMQDAFSGNLFKD